MNVTRMGYSDPYALSALQGNSAATSAQGVATNSDSTNDASVSGDRAAHRHRGGGKMGEAIMEALQSIGITLPTPPDAPTASGTPATGSASGTSAVAGTASSTDTAASTASATTTAGATSSAPIDLRKDMGDLMHALFQAVRGEDGSGASSTASTTDGNAGRGANTFGAGLSSLISQAANGTAPAGLETAFKTLTTDLQSLQSGGSTTGNAGVSGATAGTNAGTTGTASAADTTTTLQAFLTELQGKLGYGTSGSAASTSNLIDSIA